MSDTNSMTLQIILANERNFLSMQYDTLVSQWMVQNCHI
jgi:hypothetical protein